MKRNTTLSISTLIVVLSLSSFAAPCKPKTEHRKLVQTSVQAMQRDKVNSGKELWRLDAAEVAKRECEAVAKGSTAKQVTPGDRSQTFSCTAAASGGANYELTLQKPEWLLPYAGIYKMMMWVVTDVKTTCPK